MQCLMDTKRNNLETQGKIFLLLSLTYTHHSIHSSSMFMAFEINRTLKGAKKKRLHKKSDPTSNRNNSGKVGPIYLKINERIVHNSEPGHTKLSGSD